MRLPKASPLSVRLPRGLLERLERTARRKGVPKSLLVERFIDEGLRMGEHPGIFFADGPAGRRPRLWRGPDVWEVISTLKVNDGSVRTTAEILSLPEREVRMAVGYYAEHPEEIDEWIRANDEEALRAEAAWRRQQELTRE